MSTQSILVEDYSRNSWLVRRHLEGLSDADAFIQPGGTGNCIHWIFGHILLCRVEMLAWLGQPAPVTAAALKRYDTGSQPVGPASTDVCSLEQLKAWWDAVDKVFIPAIQNASDETLQRMIDGWNGMQPLENRLHFFHFHETFHIGQFEILRHLAGKTEALI